MLPAVPTIRPPGMMLAVYAGVFRPATLGWVMFLCAVVWSWRTAAARDPVPASRPDWEWWLLIGGALLCFRWPLLWLPHELYPDESQLIAGAITLRHDPMFWRSVDGGTAGPLDYYAVLPAAFTFGTAAYAMARFMAVVLLWGTLIAAGESLANVAGRAVARLAVLPLLAFEAFTTSPEFVHYSTELAPNVILAAAAYVITRQTVRPATNNVWLAALLLGAAPFSKLQVAPLAAVLWLFLAIQEVRASRRANLGRLFIGALLPVLAVGVLATLAGETENLIIPYLLHNFEYVQGGRQSVGFVALQQWQQAQTNGYLALWLIGSAVFLLGSLALARNASSILRRFQLAALILLATATACVFAPGRPFNHYLNLLTLPLSLLLGFTLVVLLQPATALPVAQRRLLVAFFLVCCVAPQALLRASNRPDPFEYYNTADRGPAYRELASAVRAMTMPGEALGVWGWRSSLYVETGLRQATRQAHNEAQLIVGPWQQYFLRRYLADFQTNQPPVFVDTMGPKNFRYQYRRWGHEIYPPLDEWVRTHYTFLAEVDAARIYVRNDRFDAAKRAWPPAHP